MAVASTKPRPSKAKLEPSALPVLTPERKEAVLKLVFLCATAKLPQLAAVEQEQPNLRPRHTPARQRAARKQSSTTETTAIPA